MDVRKAVGSFLWGMLLTMVLVVLVPVLMDIFVERYIVDTVGDSTFLGLTSDVLISILTWAVVIGFMAVLGATMVLRRFGALGILGLVFAYWLLGDIMDAFVPLATLAIVLVVGKTIQIRRRKRAGSTEGDGS